MDPDHPADAPGPPPEPTSDRLRAAGRTSWAVLGVVGLLVVAGFLASRLTVIWVSVVLALFPAALLTPVANWLKRRRVPPALAALLALLGAILLVALIFGAMVPFVMAEAPGLAESVSEGVAQLERFLQDDPLGIGINGVADALEMVREQIGEAGDVIGQAAEAAMIALETLIGLLLTLVVLFFYLKDGPRLADGVLSVLPRRWRRRSQHAGEQAWHTLSAYLRGQLLVALVDAVAIGIGLVVLGIPLALPLAVLIFFGGLFPIVGAVVTGALAVLVALADAGLTMALVVLGLVLLVQQLEGNVLEPLILGHAVRLHPLVVLLSITTGAVVLGILGAFIAVPIAAIIARIVEDQPPAERVATPPDTPSDT